MSEFLTAAFLIPLFTAGVRMSVPLILGSVGEVVAEKTGVMNIGLEGQMLIAALVSFIGAYFTGSLALGILCGGLSGMLTALGVDEETALQDACFMDSFMANVRAQIDNCECVTTIPVNMMADELVDMLKAEYMDRYVPLSRLLGIGADEAARIVQAILDGSKAVQRRKFGQKRRIHQKGHDISDRKPEKESRPDHPALA